VLTDDIQLQIVVIDEKIIYIRRNFIKIFFVYKPQGRGFDFR
jgi:hypothetical protein